MFVNTSLPLVLALGPYTDYGLLTGFYTGFRIRSSTEVFGNRGFYATSWDRYSTTTIWHAACGILL